MAIHVSNGHCSTPTTSRGCSSLQSHTQSTDHGAPFALAWIVDTERRTDNDVMLKDGPLQRCPTMMMCHYHHRQLITFTFARSRAPPPRHLIGGDGGHGRAN